MHMYEASSIQAGCSAKEWWVTMQLAQSTRHQGSREVNFAVKHEKPYKGQDSQKEIRKYELPFERCC